MTENESNTESGTTLSASEAREKAESSTKAIYEKITALSDPQRRVLIGETLGTLQTTLRETANNPDALEGFLSVAEGLVAIVGFANEVTRENHDETSTSDSKVREVLDIFKAVVKEAALSQFSPEQREAAQGIVDRVKARVAAGEDFNVAVRSEYAKAGDVFGKVAAAKEVVTANDDGDGYGLYL